MSGQDFSDEIAAFRAAHPEAAQVEVFVIDLNGTARGKLVPVEALEKLQNGGMKMPASTPTLDIFGEDTLEAGLAVQTGDPDGVCRPVPGTLGPMLWADRPTGQVQITVETADGDAPDFDPRHVLAAVEARAAAAGLTPVMALELEFYLIDPEEPLPPHNPHAGGRLAGGQVYDTQVLRAFEPILTQICDAARALGAETETIIPEFGQGQFEVNLIHCAGACQAADRMVALRRAIRGVARAHGLDATFMAKPYGDQVGSGLHLHFSLQDGQGHNIFSGGDVPNDPMRHAIGGLLRHMPDSQLIFAPHLNSYRRMMPGLFVPVEAVWAMDNRGSAVRVPETGGPGARVEHRVAGADANPYLVAAAILAAALDGIATAAVPPEPATGEILPGAGTELPQSWESAHLAFAGSDFIAEALGGRFRHVFAAMKRQERDVLLAQVTDREYATYLRRV